MKFKSELAPKGLQFNPSDFVISDKYATILTVISYPRFIGPGYLSNLTNMSGVKLVIKHIPVPFTVLAKMLNKEISDLRSRYQQEKDRTIQERIRQDVESLEYFIQQFTASQAKTFDFQMHIMVTANTREELEMKKVSLKNYMDAMELRAIPLRFEQERVLKSILPVFEKQPIEDRIGTPMPSPTMAAMYPFIFDSIKDDGLSTLLGVDFSGGVVLFNQFLYQLRKESNRNNANMIILGTSGSGKSTAAKLILRSHIRNGYQIVAVDPEGEISEMTKMYGGDVVDLGKGGELWGIASRTDYDLTCHQKVSGKSMDYIDPETNERYIPYVIEPSVGVERTILTVLCDSYTEESLEDGTTREVMKFHPYLAPYKACILPLVKKYHSDKAMEIYRKLSKTFMITYDESGSIGKRYRREDALGTPLCITIDDDTINNGTVTIRDRDTMKQDTIKIEDIENYIEEKIKF